MPEKKIIEKARKLRKKGKALTAQAAEFVREEIRHIRGGKHGARSPKQIVAIGLSKARRAGIRVPRPQHGASVSKSSGARSRKLRQKKPSAKRSQATLAALKREPKNAASGKVLSLFSHRNAFKRTPAERRKSALRAQETKGKHGRQVAARKAAYTRAMNRAA